MRIMIAAAFYPPYRGGYAESVSGFAAALAARGHAVTVVACATDGSAFDETADGVHIVRIPAWNPNFLHGSFPIPLPFAAWHAFRRAQGAGCDVISTQTRFFPITFLAFLFAKAHGIPTVHTERGSAHPDSHNFLLFSVGWLVDHTLGFVVCRYSDAVVGVSRPAAAFARHLGARAPEAIPNGIDAAWWHRPSERISDRSVRITFVGRLVHAKGVQDLLLAVLAIRSGFPALLVSVVGDGPYRSALVRAADAFGIRDIVSFHGELDGAGIRDILWRTTVFANPSHSEGLPRSVLEAAAAGLPIVATDVGGTREIIVLGSGTLVPPCDPIALAKALSAMLSDSSVRAACGRAAQAHVIERFAWGPVISAYEKTYSAACGVL